MPGSGKAKVPTHPLVEALNPDPAKPPRPTVKLFGLPGPAPDADHTRLWLDEGLAAYVDVPNDAILYSKTLPDDAGTVLWVPADAPLTHGSVSSHETQASFLTGNIAASLLTGVAMAPGAMAPGQFPTRPLPTIPTACPSACGPCASYAPPCISLPFCPSETMPPSHCGPCPTHFPPCPVTNAPPCPTHFPPCGTTHFPQCPTHFPPCPVVSAQAICPTPSAVGGCPSGIACGGQVGGGGVAE